MTPNFIDKGDGCVCDKKQTNENWIATNSADGRDDCAELEPTSRDWIM